MQNIAFLRKTIPLCNKQQNLTTYEAQFIKKLSNTETELKKSVYRC